MKNIKKALGLLNRDLTSGNGEGIGLGYPNCIDWDMVNAWCTEVWRELTGDIDHSYFITPGTTAMLSWLASCWDGRKWKEKTQVFYMLAPYYSGAFEILGERNTVRVFDTVDEICTALRESNECSMVYLVPTCRNPDGYTMTDEEVLAVIEASRIWDTVIIEDDPYFFLSNAPVAPRGRFLCNYERTIYLNSFSKCLGTPGTRVGCFACSDEKMRGRIWNDMMAKFIYPDPSKIAFLMSNMDPMKLPDAVAHVRAEIEMRQSYFGFEGFYMWKKKDNRYFELLAQGFKVKDGALFGEKYADWYRASLAHVPRESVEYDVLKKIYIYA